MRSREIPATEWRQFTEAFSRQHEGWLVSLFTEPQRGERQCVARDVPFRGIAAETDAGGQAVVIMVDGSGNRHLSHTISKPAEIVVEETDEGAEVALSVASEFGTRFTIEFRTPMVVTDVDGVLKESDMNDLKDSLREWGFDIGTFEAKAKQSIENARGDLSEITGVLRESLGRTKQVLLDLQKSREPVADELKNGFERAWTEIEQAFGRARRRMRETRQPAATRDVSDDWSG